MPSRLACAAILLFWAYAAGALFRRDMLPDLWTQPPPDLRAVARAEGVNSRAAWTLSIAEDSGVKGYRSVGRADTTSTVAADGSVELRADVHFDSVKLLKGTPFAPRDEGASPTRDDRIFVKNLCVIDRTGNLRTFVAEVRPQGVGEAPPLLTLDGKVSGRDLVVRSTSPFPLMNWTRKFPYEAKGMIQNAVGPIDRLPGLQAGQRWETRVVSPLSGRVETVKTEVTGRHLIFWDNTWVQTMMVVQHMAPISARTWVGMDGLVLKQEIPFPFVKLVLERQRHVPEETKSGNTDQ